ncbi:RNA polymerase sigma factor [Fimbriiglobus ruber]|uniref:RNA polymerase sigma-70 ECF-like HTH domain-containing protein n=1 Tax=Fimbriiglobus ruber TaxID=1908690 RepID=A0A225E4G7_9BACT|nr:sigma-70 family RNA polymerase sigma factor [Fimbriiglobus ruber]OWK46654.1 hypothetical protein FRUB_00353 [Fimbriiglobus ruber]
MTGGPPDELLEQLGRGDIDAASDLFATYAPYLRAVVRHQLSDRLRSKFDSADVVQSVWVQVVEHLGRAGWRFEDRDQLRALLATIARRRLIGRVRHLARAAEHERPAGEELEASAAASDPRPSEVVQADELWNKMLDLCPAAHHDILRLRREGLTLTEIASRTGLHEGSVRRILRQLSRELALKGEPLSRPTRPDTGTEA